ncbi:MAG: ABC transporter permease [Verrucomicrobia bacterium]|nr:ABC transporter permease [Verrucomicrobiota bacterium]
MSAPKKTASTGARIFESTIVIVALVGFWQLASHLGWVTPTILPSPWAVAKKAWQSLIPLEAFDPAKGSYVAWVFSGEILHDSVASLARVAVGFLIGGGLALPLGLAMGASDRVYKLMNPLIQILRPIPPIAYIPLSILWFGLGNKPAWFLISIGAFFPVLINTIAGVRNVDGIYIRAARNLGADRLTLFRRVILPAAMPYILTGVKIGIGVAFIVVIVAEMIAVNSGLGYRITEAREYFWSDKIIVGMIAIGLLGLVIDLLISKLNNHLLRWHRGMDS